MKYTKKLSVFMAFLVIISCTNHGMEPNADFLNAIQNNDCSKIIQLLDEDTDINAIIEPVRGLTALMLAAYYGHEEAVQCLLNNPNIVIDQQDNERWTALMFAAGTGNGFIIKMLLKNGADCNIDDSAGDTALMIAVRKGNIDATQSLLSCKNIVINQQDDQGNTALLMAIEGGNEVIIKQLLNAGADPELANYRGLTSIQQAQEIGNKEIMNLLRDFPYLFVAAQRNDCSMIMKLLNNPTANINTVDADGNTALMYAAYEGNIDAVKCLINSHQHIIKINQQNDDGYTALLWAIDGGNKAIIKLLLDAGADPELANNKGLTPRNAAIRVIFPEGYREAVEFFDPFAENPPQRFNVPVRIESDAEILSLINKAIIKKHGGINPFIKTQQ